MCDVNFGVATEDWPAIATVGWALVGLRSRCASRVSALAPDSMRGAARFATEALSEDEYSDEVDENLMRHTASGKPKRALTEQLEHDIQAALTGKAGYDNSDEELPESLLDPPGGASEPAPATPCKAAPTSPRPALKSSASVASFETAPVETPKSGGRWKRGFAIAKASTKAIATINDLRQVANKVKQLATSATNGLEGVREDERASFAEHLDLHDVAKEILDGLMGEGEAAAGDNTGTALAKLGASQRHLDFYPDLASLNRVADLDSLAGDITQAKTEEELNAILETIAEQHKNVKSVLAAVRQSCQNVSMHIKSATRRQEKKTAVEVHKKVVAIATRKASGAAKQGGHPAIFDYSFDPALQMNCLTASSSDYPTVPIERVALQDKPVCIKMPQLWQEVASDASLMKEMALFQSDCVGSREFEGPSGRACKFTGDLQRVAENMMSSMPPNVVAPSREELLQWVPDEKKNANVSKITLASNCHLWGMAPNRTFIGFDLLALGVARLCHTGFRQIVMLRCESFVKVACAKGWLKGGTISTKCATCWRASAARLSRSCWPRARSTSASSRQGRVTASCRQRGGSHASGPWRRPRMAFERWPCTLTRPTWTPSRTSTRSGGRGALQWCATFWRSSGRPPPRPLPRRRRLDARRLDAAATAAAKVSRSGSGRAERTEGGFRTRAACRQGHQQPPQPSQFTRHRRPLRHREHWHLGVAVHIITTAALSGQPQSPPFIG